jgi:hypothetical protein
VHLKQQATSKSALCRPPNQSKRKDLKIKPTLTDVFSDMKFLVISLWLFGLNNS